VILRELDRRQGSFAFKAMGFKIIGDLMVTDSKVMIDAHMPHGHEGP